MGILAHPDMVMGPSPTDTTVTILTREKHHPSHLLSHLNPHVKQGVINY